MNENRTNSEVSRNKGRVRARVNNYLKTNNISKGNCQVCGEVAEEVHHPDHTKEWGVNFLCHGCHKKITYDEISCPEPTIIEQLRGIVSDKPFKESKRQRVNIVLDKKIVTNLRKLSTRTGVPMSTMVDKAIMEMYGKEMMK